MTGICDGRVVIVTGAGRGLGRAHALELGRQGASVIVNDLGSALDGTGTSSGPADEVVAEIEDAGGVAAANGADVSDFEAAAGLVDFTIATFGGLDAVVNNAGIVRDRMFANATADEWDATMAVNLKGHFTVSRHAAAWWRTRSKTGEAVDARIVNTSSGAGIMGSIGQAAYSAAKGGIAALTLVQAAELGRYGVTSNAIAPAARTRMTQGAFEDMMAEVGDDAFDAMDPANVSPLIAWLVSADSAGVTGRMFEIEGDQVGVADGWQHGPTAHKGDARWDAAELGDVVRGLIAAAPDPAPVYGT